MVVIKSAQAGNVNVCTVRSCGFPGNMERRVQAWYKVKRHQHLKRFPAAKRDPERQMFEQLCVPAGAWRT